MKLSTRVDRPLIRAGERAERHIQFALTPPAGETKRLPINLALVLDRSGSMSGEKLARAKEAASFAVRHLTSADRVAIVAYDDAVTTVHASALLTPPVKAAMLRAIAGLDTGGSTNLSGGWLTGCQEVAKHQQGSGQLDRVVLLTDGLANVGIVDHAELCHHAAELRQRGIVTSTMGIGRDFNEELLEALARQGGGRFQYVETAKHIPDCVQGELGEILSIAARRVEVDVVLPEGAKLVDLLNELPTESLPNGVRIRLDDLLAGDEKKLLLRLALPSTALGAETKVEAVARWLDVASGESRQDIFPAAGFTSADPATVDAQPTDDEVMAEIAVLMAAREREEAIRLSRQGRHAAAQQTLQQSVARLSAMSPTLAAPAAARVEATLAELAPMAAQAAPLSETQRKELHYQAYLTRDRRARYDDKGDKDDRGRKA